MGETEFLKVFGRITVSDILIWILAIGYLVPKIRQFYGWSRKYWQKAEKREQAISNAGKFDDFRHKADDAHEELQRQIMELQKAVDGINERMDKRDKADQEKRLNKTYSQIVQLYQYYTSEERNPLQAWTAMEADVFWKVFRDYEDDGGDGYVHSEIEPAMRQLRTVEMYDRDESRKLMQSRR